LGSPEPREARTPLPKAGVKREVRNDEFAFAQAGTCGTHLRPSFCSKKPNAASAPPACHFPNASKRSFRVGPVSACRTVSAIGILINHVLFCRMERVFEAIKS